MIRDAYRSVAKVRGPNLVLHWLSLLSAGLGQMQTNADDLAVRIRRTRNKELFDKIYAEVLQTPALRCNPRSNTAIHTVTARHHLYMYLTAIKSLLRFDPDVTVVVHDDGSLGAEGQALVEQHIPGATFLRREDADKKMNDLLRRYPHCRQLRQRVVNSFELFDNLLLGSTARIVNLNSDVLFLEKPTELLAWLSDGTDMSTLGVFEAKPAGQAAFLERQGSSFSPTVTTALCCMHRGVCDLDFVESVLANSPIDWFTAQNVYPLLFERSLERHPMRFFDADTYQASGIFGGGAVFRHYWTSTGKFTPIQEADCARVLSSLRA
jgi:hypothetical protein